MSADRPRVAQVIPWLSLGGATGLLIQLTGRLLREGYEVEVFTGPSTESGVSMSGFVEELGVPVHTVPSFRRAPHPPHDVRALRQLTELFRAGRFDIVHAHGTKGFLLGAWAARRAGIQPTIWHVHGWGFHEHSSALARAAVVSIHRLLESTASRIVAVSEATRRYGLACRIGEEDQYRVIYEAVDLERFCSRPLPVAQAKQRLGLDPARPVVGSITRLAAQKAPLDLIDSFILLLERMPEAQLLLVGHGPLFEACKARVAERRAGDSVVMPGPRWDVPDVLAAVDVFALTSLWEGFPICYLEALAMGIPVVGTDAGGAAEAVIDGRTGYIVPPKRLDLVAERMETLLRDADLRREMGEAGREHAARFGYDRLLADVSKLYSELLSGVSS